MENYENKNQIEQQEAQEAAKDAPEAAVAKDTATAAEAAQNAPQDAHSMNYTHTFSRKRSSKIFLQPKRRFWARLEPIPQLRRLSTPGQYRRPRNTKRRWQR